MALQSQIMPAFYTLPFIKMQGNGNDFIFLDGEALLNSAARPLLSQWTAVAPMISKLLCCRRFSIGADGLILALPLHIPELADLARNWYGPLSKNCELAWTYNNSDGSVSNICGNGLRCLGLWGHQKMDLGGHFKVATAIGALDIYFQNENNITVTLGAPRLRAADIPFVSDQSANENVINKQFKLDNHQFQITCVNVGNPHCVIFEADFLKPELFSNKSKNMADDFFPEQLKQIAGSIETDSHFPQRTNVEFVRVLNRQHIDVLVWERGCGATLSCGSGATAAAVASILENRTDKQVEVTLPGGTLFIDWSNENIIKMTGGASLSFHGQIDISTKQLVQDTPRTTKVGVL